MKEISGNRQNKTLSRFRVGDQQIAFYNYQRIEKMINNIRGYVEENHGYCSYQDVVNECYKIGFEEFMYIMNNCHSDELKWIINKIFKKTPSKSDFYRAIIGFGAKYYHQFVDDSSPFKLN